MSEFVGEGGRHRLTHRDFAFLYVQYLDPYHIEDGGHIDSDGPIADPSGSQDLYLNLAPEGYLVSLGTRTLFIRRIKMKGRNCVFACQHQDHGGGSIAVSGTREVRECVYVG